jgi:hypothetical protein
VAALGVTGYARLLGKKLERTGDVPVEGGTTRNPATPEDVGRAQRQLTALQWLIPVLIGAVLVVNARMVEQQRPPRSGRAWFVGCSQVTGGRQLSSALPAGGREVVVGVPVRAAYHGPAGWAGPMVDPGQRPQGGPQTDSLEERARRRVMVRARRLCAATVAAPQGGKR